LHDFCDTIMLEDGSKIEVPWDLLWGAFLKMRCVISRQRPYCISCTCLYSRGWILVDYILYLAHSFLSI
jgi:hypothetical protein